MSSTRQSSLVLWPAKAIDLSYVVFAPHPSFGPLTAPPAFVEVLPCQIPT